MPQSDRSPARPEDALRDWLAFSATNRQTGQAPDRHAAAEAALAALLAEREERENRVKVLEVALGNLLWLAVEQLALPVEKGEDEWPQIVAARKALKP